MIVTRRADDPTLRRPTTVTLGVFDGLHLGHQAIMRTLVERAAETGTASTVVTFDPHPRSVLHPESAPPLLQTFEQRLEGMRFLGVEQVVALEFTRELAALTAEASHDTVKLSPATTTLVVVSPEVGYTSSTRPSR